MRFADLCLPLLRCLDPERAHGLAIAGLKAGLGPHASSAAHPGLTSRVWGLDFPNPVGLSAGFDKHGEVPRAMLKAGFGFVEIGSVTPRPQPGNPRPRLFRLARDKAVINRFGFNSQGIQQVARNLKKRPPGIIGGNLGKNKTSPDAVADYVEGARHLAPLCDYLVINVSSPNTPGLRNLQAPQELRQVIEATAREMARCCIGNPPPLLVKIAPDLSDEDKQDITDLVLKTDISGLIVSNTTISRDGLKSKSELTKQAGGLSGKPLFEPSTKLLGQIYRLTGGRIPLVGVGGISNGRDAYEKIRAGASLVQIYSALVFEGLGLVPKINDELCRQLRSDGFEKLADAVGSGN